MGSVISAIRDQIHEADDKEKQRLKENLNQLEEIAKNKILVMKDDILLNQSNTKEIPIDQILRWNQDYKVDINDDGIKSIDGVIDDFFGGQFMAGLKDLVKKGVNGLVGSGDVGANEKIDYYIIFFNDSVCRIDIQYYFYKLHYEGIYTSGENLLAYLYSISTVDIKNVKSGSLIFLVTEQLDKSIFSAKTEEERNVLLKEKEELVKAIKELYKNIESKSK
jgi:hypothetical protein